MIILIKLLTIMSLFTTNLTSTKELKGATRPLLFNLTGESLRQIEISETLKKINFTLL